MPGLCYLTWWHQVKRVEQEKTEALDEEHVVAVFPDQEEDEGGGTHGKIAKHLQKKYCLSVSVNAPNFIILKKGFIRSAPQWRS